MRLGNLVLPTLVLLRDGIGEPFLAVRLAVIVERTIDLERERAGQAGHAGMGFWTLSPGACSDRPSADVNE